MVHIKVFTFNPFQENTYLIYDDQSNAIIIDPGCSDKREFNILQDFIENHQLKVYAILNTHCHIDHVLGNYEVKAYFKVPLWIPEDEKVVFQAVKSYASNYGFPQYTEAEVDGFISKNQVIEVGEIYMQSLYVPGHAPGHLAFWLEKQNACINGDVLFDGSIGRTDLPGGDFDTLIHSIHTVMFSLPNDTVVYCGHGPSTTIIKEKMSNPFCAIKQ